jgi:hypothetical protein
MNNEVEKYVGELASLRKEVEELKEENEKFKKIFKHSLPAKLGDAYFICGESESKDEMNLPEQIFICPAYGLEGSAIYTKTADYSAPSY